jgi:Flp pilus assembly pilin Flp
VRRFIGKTVQDIRKFFIYFIFVFAGEQNYSIFPIALTERGKQMRFIGRAVLKVMKDESGGEVLEYALIAGLIVVAAIGVIGKVGTKVLARWGSLNSSM